MNWVDQETLRIMSQRGKPGPRLVRGLIWAVLAIFPISILLFLSMVLAGMLANPRI